MANLVSYCYNQVMQEKWGKQILKHVFLVGMALFFIGVFFVLAPKAKASSDIVINEIYPAPISSCDPGVDSQCTKEWIELFNPTVNNVILSGYSLFDSGDTPYKLDGKAIAAGGYLVIYNGSGGFSFALNNDGDSVILKTNVIIDQIKYPDFTNYKGKSFARVPNGYGDFRIVDKTPNDGNLLKVYSDAVIINEILPEPVTGSNDEFIELFNTGMNEVDLSGWRLDDGTPGSEYEIPVGIKIGGPNFPSYLTFQKSVTKISLNDTTSDFAVLIDPNGDTKYQVPAYLKATRGQSYSKFSDDWQWTTTLTPNAANILTIEVVVADQDAPILTTDIAGARNQPNGETVSVTGIVSVTPGKLSSQYFYIQDGNSGIQIYSYSKLFPALSVGDQIQVIGEMGSISNERRIKISQPSDIQILSIRSPPEPINITIDQLDENYEGCYVHVFGTVTKTSGSTFYIHGSGEIQVSIRAGTGIKKPKMRVGDRVEIAGILSQYGDSYRILPIVQSDVKIVKSFGLAKTGPDGVVYIVIISAILSWITLAILYRKQRI